MAWGWSLAHEVVQGTQREVDCLAMARALAVLGLWSQGSVWQGQRVFHWVSLEYRFFSFFLLSECLCHKYPTLALFVHVKACPWGRVCAIRSQEAVYGN